MAVEFCVCIDEVYCKLLTLYWLRKLPKRPNKSLIIANSGTCTITKSIFYANQTSISLDQHQNKGAIGAVKND